jgi:hypothetical protein
MEKNLVELIEAPWKYIKVIYLTNWWKKAMLFFCCSNSHILILIRHSLQASIASTHRHVHIQIVVLGSFLQYSWLFFCSSIQLNQLILLLRMWTKQQHVCKEMNQYMINTNRKWILSFGIEWTIGVKYRRADRSLGAKQEGLTIVHFLNKLIVSCKEALRFPF